MEIWEDERSKIIFLHSFQLVTRLNSQNRNETSLLMNSDTLICIWILAFPIGIIRFESTKMNFFYFVSVPYTITELQPLQYNYYKSRWVKWSDVKTFFSASQNAKNESQLKHKNQVRIRFLLTVRSSSMKDYTCH